MFTLEEQTRSWERRHPQYARKVTPENAERYERLLEAVRIAEEAAMTELAAFVTIEPPEMHNLAEWPGVLRKGAILESFAGHFGTHEEYAE